MTAETVTVDGNHPLAGQSLNFDVKVVSVREAGKKKLPTDMFMDMATRA